jgi:hypothetical protein
MAITQRIGGVLLALALTPLAAACTATPVPTPTVTLTPSPSPTATTLSPAEQDLASAKQAVVKLWAVVDRLTNNPKSSIQDLDDVASGEALEFFRKNLVGYRIEQLTGSGSSIVEVQSAQASGTNAQGLAAWTVTACIDASKTKLVDTKGKSVTAPPYRILHRSVIVELSRALHVDQDEVLGTC